jgi:hypothetical protein
MIVDLLNPQAENLHVREDMKRGVYVDNLIEETVESTKDLMEVLNKGKANRHVGATAMNKESSRSHSVFTLQLESKHKRDGIINILSSRFHIIDLAGSERQKFTNAVGERLKEAGKINKSLSALGNVINSLVDVFQGKSRHIHYRDSKLTFLLKDSLGGNSRTVVIANVAQNLSSVGETLSTLNFAKRAKLIKNKAVVNEDTAGTVLLLQQEIKRLKAEIVNLKAVKLIDRTPGKVVTRTERKSELENLLQGTIELRAEDIKMHEELSKEKDDLLEMLTISIKRCQRNRERDNAILKLKENALEKLQEGKSVSEEIQNLKVENKLLREEEDEALAKIVEFTVQSSTKDQIIQKNNEHLIQLNNYVNELVEENKLLKEKCNGTEIEEIVAKLKLSYCEKIEELTRKYTEYFVL